MGLYEELTFVDVVEPIRPLLDAGKLTWDVEKKKVVIPVALRWNYPWIMGKIDPERTCGLWLEFYFKFYSILPRECQRCWKVVARPKTLRQLFGIMNLQKEQKFPGKCGMENRSFVPGESFGAFWYLPLGVSEAEAIVHKREIEKEVASKVGLGIPFIVKRACTEMELYFGPSNTWEFNESMSMKQDLLDAFYEFTPVNDPQPGALVTHIQRQWIERAWKDGDPTVWEFAEKESFPLPSVNYDVRKEAIHVVH